MLRVTKQQIEILQLGIAPIDERVILTIGGGLEWLQRNTILEFDMNNDEDLKALPYCARLFLISYFDITTAPMGVASESIGGLSQSFSSTSRDKLIWEAATQHLQGYLKSGISFISAKRKWV